MATRQWFIPGGGVVHEEGTEEYFVPGVGVVAEDQAIAPSGPFVITRFNTDSGLLDKVIALIETQLETIDDTKTLHLVDIERLSVGGYRGTILYDT